MSTATGETGQGSYRIHRIRVKCVVFEGKNADQMEFEPDKIICVRIAEQNSLNSEESEELSGIRKEFVGGSP